MKATFDSSRTFGLFTAHFDSELYHRAASYHESRSFGFLNYIYSVVGVAKVLEDVEISQRNRSPYRSIKRFLEEDFCQIHNDAQIINKFNRYLTASIFIRMDQKMDEKDITILSVSDSRAKIYKPEWWQDRGICYGVNSYAGKLEITAKAGVTGKAQVRLSGIFGTDYTTLNINGKTILNALQPAWSDKPYVYDMEVKAGEIITVYVEWLPHMSLKFNV